MYDHVRVAGTYAHEAGHWSLSRTPLLRLQRRLTRKLQSLVLADLCQSANRFTIQVPLVPDPAGHPVQRVGATLATIKQRTQAIEEVFAVWMSLYQLYERRLISAGMRQSRVRAAKRIYHEDFGFKAFPALYDDFASIADVVGLDSAFALVNAALTAPIPDQACAAMIQRAREYLRRGAMLSDPQTAATLFTDIAYEQLRSYTSDQNREELLDVIQAMIEKEMGPSPSPPAVMSWLDDPQEPVFCSFDDHHLQVDVQRLGGNMAVLWIESIRQQLVTGIGLCCPLALKNEPGVRDCCGLRAFLEAVWSHTTPSAENNLWRRQGCLTVWQGRYGDTGSA